MTGDLTNDKWMGGKTSNTESESLYFCGTPDSGVSKFRTPDSDCSPKKPGLKFRAQNQTPTLTPGRNA